MMIGIIDDNQSLSLALFHEIKGVNLKMSHFIFIFMGGGTLIQLIFK